MLLDTIVTRVPVEKGWSGDKKYRACDACGNTWLLRISPETAYPKKALLHQRMEQAAALDIPMCRSLEFGRCDDGVYSLQSWIEGHDAEDVIPSLPPARQYRYGLDAGAILRKLHTLPAPADAEPWADRYGRKIDRKLAAYESCPIQYEDGSVFIRFIAENRHLLSDRTQSYQHGDYHIGNMMVDSCGTLTIIDFDRDDYGDPWEEFNRIVWCGQKAPIFAKGMVDGYFDGAVPEEFWKLLALYICTNTLSSLPWALRYGEREIAVMRAQAKDILSWYNSFTTVIPSWYRGDTTE